MTPDRYMFLVVAAAGTISVATPSFSQQVSASEAAGDPQLTASALINSLDDLNRAVQPQKLVSIQGVGSGTVASRGLVFGSVSGTDQRNAPGSGIDGSLSLGAGFGDPEAGVGGQVTLNITSADWDDFGDSGYLSAKFGTRIFRNAGNTYAAVNFDGLAPWGDSSDMDIRTTMAVTTFNEVGGGQSGEMYPLMLTAGVTSHDGDGDSNVSPILGAGIGLSEFFSASTSYNGDYVNVGMGAKLPWFESAVTTLTLNDVFDDEEQQRAVLAVSFATTDLFKGLQ